MFVVIQCFFVNLHRVMKIHTFIYKTYLVKVAARRQQYDKDCSTRALTNVTAPPCLLTFVHKPRSANHHLQISLV